MQQSAPSFVRIGRLEVAPRLAADVRTALAYLSRDPVERGLIDRVERGAAHVRIVAAARGNDSYDPGTHTIRWDPHGALRTTAGGHQSPALGLGHELDHAVHDGTRTQRLAALPDARYDNREERRVVTGSERHAARTLGESARTDHAGTSYRVASPVALALGRIAPYAAAVSPRTISSESAGSGR